MASGSDLDRYESDFICDAEDNGDMPPVGYDCEYNSEDEQEYFSDSQDEDEAQGWSTDTRE